jgi:hypothetical protein
MVFAEGEPEAAPVQGQPSEVQRVWPTVGLLRDLGHLGTEHRFAVSDYQKKGS